MSPIGERAAAFKHPRDVVSHPDLTLNEKRDLIVPGMRGGLSPASRQPSRVAVTFDDVADAPARAWKSRSGRLGPFVRLQPRILVDA